MAVIAGLAIATVVTRPAFNYTDPQGPRFSGVPAEPAVDPDPGHLLAVTLNVRFANNPGAAADLLKTHPELAGADVVALQEMDARGTAAIAARLGLGWVYYPAAVHPRAGSLGTGSDFGNAVLSRWPVTSDRKLILPGRSFPRRMQRVATVAEVDAPDGPLRVYSVHLETPIALTPWARAAQVGGLIDDARSGARVLVLGDMNAHDLPGRVFTRAGFDWPTEDGEPTVSRFAWDHAFTRGLPGATGRGVVDAGAASDHRAVWVSFLSTAPRRATPATPPPASSGHAGATPPA